MLGVWVSAASQSDAGRTIVSGTSWQHGRKRNTTDELRAAAAASPGNAISSSFGTLVESAELAPVARQKQQSSRPIRSLAVTAVAKSPSTFFVYPNLRKQTARHRCLFRAMVTGRSRWHCVLRDDVVSRSKNAMQFLQLSNGCQAPLTSARHPEQSGPASS
jgi:hypothetical protein